MGWEIFKSDKKEDILPAPTVSGAAYDSHANRQKGHEAEMTNIKTRLPSMASIQNERDFLDVEQYIRWAGRDLDGNLATIFDAYAGDTTEQLEIDVQRASMSPQNKNCRVYAIGRLFNSVRVLVYKGGEKVEDWEYQAMSKIEHKK